MTARQIPPLVTAHVAARIGSKSLQSLNCAGVTP
jgi:hypothetical protein